MLGECGYVGVVEDWDWFVGGEFLAFLSKGRGRGYSSCGGAQST